MSRVRKTFPSPQPSLPPVCGPIPGVWPGTSFFPVGLAPQVTSHCWHLSNSLSSFSASPCCVPGTWCFAPCSAHNKTCWESWCFRLAMLKQRCSIFSLVHPLFLCLCGHRFIKLSMPVDQTVFAGILCKCEIITRFFSFHKDLIKENHYILWVEMCFWKLLNDQQAVAEIQKRTDNPRHPFW